MSGPFDRTPHQSSQPPSFKTDVNRKKTKRWVEAKSYSYDGDDWADFDETDEYGVQSPSQPEPAKPTGLRQKGQGVGETPRSVTGPIASSSGLNRMNSFDVGDERRTFSSGTHQLPPSGNLHQPGHPPDYGPPQGPSAMAPPQPGYQGPPQQHSGAPLHVQTNVGHPPQAPDNRDQYAGRNRSGSSAPSNVSETPSSADPLHRRDFSPTAMPPPLHSRSPVSAPTAAPIAGARFPARKSSRASEEPGPSFQPPPPSATPPSQVRSPVNNGKSLPFIRPADIYKRMEEARQKERASMDSERPSLESLRPSSIDSKDRVSPDSSSRSNLDPVKEVAEPTRGAGNTAPSLHTDEAPISASKAPATSPGFSLPPVGGISTFGDDFWSGGVSNPAPAAEPDRGQPVAAQGPTDTSAESALLQHQPSLGFRSVVHQAFDAPADGKSVPPTPLLTQNSLRSATTHSDVSRSNTDSTAGISPIMSRVPGQDVDPADLTQHHEHPTIAEEPIEPVDSTTRPLSTSTLRGGAGDRQIPRKPSPSHSREHSAGSFTPGYRRDLNTPSPHNSPARSPVVGAVNSIPEPEVGELATDSSLANVTSLDSIPLSRATDMAAREADTAHAVNSSPTKEVEGAAEAQRESQETFLQYRSPSPEKRSESPSKRSTTSSRNESPSKGRVRDLAGKFNEIESKRNSVASIASHKSNSSWWNSQEDLSKRPEAKEDLERAKMKAEDSSGIQSNDKLAVDARPSMDRDPSFRPSLPGGWQSYATTAGSSDQAPEEPATHQEARAAPPDEIDTSAQKTPTVAQPPVVDEDMDLTPTTAKNVASSNQVLPADESSPSLASNPMAALAAAGNAMGEAIQQSLGMQPELAEDEQGHPPAVEDSNTPHKPRLASGDVFQRPLAPDRMDTSNSSVPPTPPAKDDAATVVRDFSCPSESVNSTLPALDTNNETSRPMIQPSLTSLSVETSDDDLESDRLRKEIVRSLSPIKSAEELPLIPPQSEPVGREASEQAGHKRQSSILPSEYDSYWKERDDAEQNPETVAQTEAPEDINKPLPAPFGVAAPDQPQEIPPLSHADSRPRLDKRFSWEESMPPSGSGTPAAVVALQESKGLHAARQPHETDAPAAEVRSIAAADGLHVVNNEDEPIAVEMPPSLSTGLDPKPVDVPYQPPTLQPVTPSVLPSSPSADKPAPSPTMAEKPHLPPFRQILALKSPEERIKTYNHTRDQFATMNTGLGDWVSKTLAAHPEHAALNSIGSRPQITTTGFSTNSGRHRTSPSFSKFGKQFPSSTSGTGSPMSPTQTESPVAAGGHGQGQGQIKAKDLMKSANVFGGKAATGAKGLFAKGRTKLRGSGSAGDKVD
ncbi:hypothetical protein K402DRAFT_274928 [Aulographum hederae CBS 113979]|uniref:Uncharacterized protein n=1 Tax=Aulographum hederae CBS 113979 TaxID=1176131 RepID=A0A6G1GIG0_9PEZI|nr:hypothetical protein K402DRAFT_274928 [Aulographum hederae CBS 113979]